MRVEIEELETLFQYEILAVTDDNEVAGYCILVVIGDDAHIFDLFVEEEYRRQGVCTMMLNTAKFIAKPYCHKLVYHTEYNNTGMIKAGTNLGFEITAEEVHLEYKL